MIYDASLLYSVSLVDVKMEALDASWTSSRRLSGRRLYFDKLDKEVVRVTDPTPDRAKFSGSLVLDVGIVNIS